MDNERITRRQVLKQGGAVGLGAAVSPLLLSACGGSEATTSQAPKGPRGVAELPTAPFEPSDKAGPTPSLPRRFGYSQPAEAEVFTVFATQLRAGCKDADVELLTGQAKGDIATNLEQINTFLTRGIAGIFVAPLDPAALKPVLQQCIDRGVMTITILQAPGTALLATSQYDFGRAQGEAAVNYITEKLGGKSKLVYYNQDQNVPARDRHRGFLDAIEKGGPGIEVVVDMTVAAQTTEKGFQVANTILRRHPDANAWVGDDAVVLGTLAALEAAKKVDERTYISGASGEQQALDKVAEGGPFKNTIAFPYSANAYAMARFVARWLDGKNVPQLILTKPILLASKADIDQFNADMKSPTQFYENPGRYQAYLGDVSYETRNRYLTVAG